MKENKKKRACNVLQYPDLYMQNKIFANERGLKLQSEWFLSQ